MNYRIKIAIISGLILCFSIAATAQEAIDGAVTPVLAASRIALAALHAVFTDRVLLRRARDGQQGQGGATHEHAAKARQPVAA